MAKQPYIPFYIGDYLKDTRILPLSVRGGWVDLILYMWDNPVKGELVGDYDDFSRLMTCSKDEAILVIQTLNQKKIFDYSELGGGQIKIESRKIKSMAKLSETRKKAGLEGGNPALVKQNNKDGLAKSKQNPEYENENTVLQLNKEEPEIQQPDPHLIFNLEKVKQNFDNDYKLHEMVVRENEFSPEEMEQAVTEFWNTKQIDPETTIKPYSDLKKHFLNWGRTNKARIKRKEKLQPNGEVKTEFKRIVRSN